MYVAWLTRRKDEINLTQSKCRGDAGLNNCLCSFVYYRPQRSWGKVMFLQASVILLTGGQGGTSPPLGADTPPPEQTSPGADPPGADTTPLEQTHPPEQTPPPPTGEHGVRYGQRAGGTHPTGMQSCFFCKFYLFTVT